MHGERDGEWSGERNDAEEGGEEEFVFEPSDAVVDPRLATRLPIDADPPEKRRAAIPIGSLMAAALKRILPPEAELLQLASDHWAEWVGGETAAYTRPGRIADGTLYIYVKGSVRLAELKRHRMQSIDARVRRMAGKSIRSIRAVIEPGD